MTCDTRDFARRRAELKETLRNMIRSAVGTATISLGVGETIVGLIASDANHTAEMFGPGFGNAVEGLESRVSWYQKGPLDLGLYIPHTLKITAPAH